MLPVKKVLESTGVLTNRQELIKSIAKELDYNYTVRKKIETEYLENFIYFKTKIIPSNFNRCHFIVYIRILRTVIAALLLFLALTPPKPCKTNMV